MRNERDYPTLTDVMEIIGVLALVAIFWGCVGFLLGAWLG